VPQEIGRKIMSDETIKIPGARRSRGGAQKGTFGVGLRWTSLEGGLRRSTRPKGEPFVSVPHRYAR
jgi:hypothetical protein